MQIRLGKKCENYRSHAIFTIKKKYMRLLKFSHIDMISIKLYTCIQAFCLHKIRSVDVSLLLVLRLGILY